MVLVMHQCWQPQTNQPTTHPASHFSMNAWRAMANCFRLALLLLLLSLLLLLLMLPLLHTNIHYNCRQFIVVTTTNECRRRYHLHCALVTAAMLQQYFGFLHCHLPDDDCLLWPQCHINVIFYEFLGKSFGRMRKEEEMH